MSGFSRRELRELRAWVKKHRMPHPDLEPEDCCCGLVDPCKHHADRQRTYASPMPPKTVERLLDALKSQVTM